MSPDNRTSKEVLSDRHTTLSEALELASECHELAEERAEDCDDEAATLLSKSGAILEMLVADNRYWRELYAREGHKSMVLQEELSKRPSHEPTADLYTLLVRRGYAQHEADAIANGPLVQLPEPSQSAVRPCDCPPSKADPTRPNCQAATSGEPWCRAEQRASEPPSAEHRLAEINRISIAALQGDSDDTVTEHGLLSTIIDLSTTATKSGPPFAGIVQGPPSRERFENDDGSAHETSDCPHVGCTIAGKHTHQSEGPQQP